MIGFQEDLHGDIPCSQEGAETRSLEKNELYQILAAQYFLPTYRYA